MTQRTPEPDRRPRSAMSASLTALGLATVAALVVGLVTWLVAELVLDHTRSAAVTTGAWAAAAVLIIGAMVGVLRALRAEQ